MTESLNSFQSWIAAQIMELRCLEKNMQWWSWGDDEETSFAGTVSVAEDPQLSAVFSLPKASGHLYLTLTDGSAEELARVMAHLDEIDATGKIHQSHVVRFDYDYLKQHGFVGVTLCAPKVSPVFKDLKEPLKFERYCAHPTLVILITQKEYEIWKNSGSDGLMDHFDKIERDIVSIQH